MIDTEWIKDHIPFVCPVCNRVLFRKDSVFIVHRVAGLVRICKRCKEEAWL